MDVVVPWPELVTLIDPHYPDIGKGRPPVGVERMLRIYFLQQWFDLSDPAVEDALYESPSMRGFVGVDLGCEPAPDETTVCKFRHLLERHELGKRIFAAVNAADCLMLPALLHGEEIAVWGDQAYQGQAEVIRQHAPQAEDHINQRWRSKLKTYPERREENRVKSKTRSRVEHIFALLKGKLGFIKVRFRGLAKNLYRLQTTCALINLCTARKHLQAVAAQSRA